MIRIRDQKKMKRQIFKKLLLVFLILAMQIMLVSGTDQNALIRNLVEQRIEIMNAFFNGTLLEKDAAAALSKVESGRLLHEDFQTDIEVVASYHVSVPKVTYRDEDVITALVRVKWITLGAPTEENEHPLQETISYYSVIVEKVEKSYKLVQFF